MQTPDPTPHRTSIPTLARLSFWVPPERIAEFEVAYREKVIPILKRHGLAESSERGRTTVEGVFSRLFEFATPKEMLEKREALRGDPAWQEALKTLRAIFWAAGSDDLMLKTLRMTFRTIESDGLIRHSFLLYAAPAGPGKVVQAGPDRVVSAGPGKGHWRTYDTSDGLANVTVLSIFQDREGYLWFGTAGGGASRYDGNTWSTFTTGDGLANNRVSSILQDREGYLWFGTIDGGVSRYDREGRRRLNDSQDRSPPPNPGESSGGGTWKTFTTRDGLADNRVTSMFQDQEGHLWFGTNAGVSRYDGKTWKTFIIRDDLANNRVSSILQDREGYLWFGTQGGGVSQYDGKAWKTFTTGDGLAHNGVTKIIQDQEGYLWFGTWGGGVSRYDPSTGSGQGGKAWKTFTTRDGLADNWVTSIFQDQEGHLWFGTWIGGVSRYDGRTWTTFTTGDGLVDSCVRSIFQDQEGHLWFGTIGGLSRFDGNIWTTFTEKDGLGGSLVRAIFQDREGHLWFGTVGGLSRYDGQKFVTVTGDRLAHTCVRSIFQDREGHLWFLTAGSEVSRAIGEVIRYDGESFTVFTTQDGLAHDSVWSVLQDREGHLWFGTTAGVSRFDGQGFTTFTAEDGLASGQVWSILQDREGHLWFGTTGGGVSRYDREGRGSGSGVGRSGESTVEAASGGGTFTTFTTRDGLANNNVWPAVLRDREGHLWFGTATGGFGTAGGGVSRFDGESFTSLTTQDGLAHDEVWSIFQDREGHLWFGTNGGVSRFDGQRFQTLTCRDGLAGNRVYSILQDREGYLWFGAAGGVTRFRPPAPWPPPVFMDAVIADRRYEDILELSVPSTAGVMIFEFHAMSFKTRPDGVVYRYRLKGYDKDWRTTRERKVEYQDLPIGDYTFEVLAVDRDLVYSEKPATVRLTVVPDPRIEALTEALSGGGKAGEFVGKSEALRRAQAQLSEVAWTDVTVLILGETGTGKGLAARAVHALSARREGPFIQVNCGAIPEGLVESELFGHEKGAFTGAVSRKLGKVEVAEGGTLFLDEIGDLPLGAQVKLLRLLEERTFERVGGTQTLRAEARVIAATNRDLKRMVSEGTFREDLYFRLQAFPVRLPPLRERREDIPQLAEYFIRQMASHLNKNVTQLTSEALALLSVYDWPGNVRELEHAVQRAVIVCRGPAIRAGDIVLETADGRQGGGTRRTGAFGWMETADDREEVTEEKSLTLEEVERRHIREVLERTGWVIRGPRGAAALLGLHEATLRFRMRKLGIRRSER